MEKQDQVLEDAGGAKGIQELREEAAAAKEEAAAAKEEAAAAKEEADSLAADKVGARGRMSGAVFVVAGIGRPCQRPESPMKIRASGRESDCTCIWKRFFWSGILEDPRRELSREGDECVCVCVRVCVRARVWRCVNWVCAVVSVLRSLSLSLSLSAVVSSARQATAHKTKSKPAVSSPLLSSLRNRCRTSSTPPLTS